MAFMGDVFTQLYPFVFVIGLAGYGPQLYKLWKEPRTAASLSLSTWVIWTSTWFISLGYGMTKLDDALFCLVAGMNLGAHIVIIALIAWHRRDEFLGVFAPETPRPVFLRVRK